jgi:hypothetical protein
VEAVKVLKQKLLDYYHQGRPEVIPDYALHRILFLYSTHPEMVIYETHNDFLLEPR